MILRLHISILLLYTCTCCQSVYRNLLIYVLICRWLQPDSYLDPSQCELMYSKEDLRCGWPALITVLTKDQYGQLVHVPNLKVSYCGIIIVCRSIFMDFKCCPCSWIYIPMSKNIFNMKLCNEPNKLFTWNYIPMNQYNFGYPRPLTSVN